MVDKMAKMGILISATLSNIRFGKEPVTGVLSHSIVNQTKLYFGLRTTRLITSLLFDGVATTNSNRCSNWAGGFLLTKIWNEPGTDGHPIPGSNHSTSRKVTMTTQDFSLPLNNGQVNPAPSESNLDSLSLQIKQTQERVNALGEFISEAMSQMYRAMLQLEQLRQQAEFGAFYEFIETLDFDGVNQ